MQTSSWSRSSSPSIESEAAGPHQWLGADACNDRHPMSCRNIRTWHSLHTRIAVEEPWATSDSATTSLAQRSQ